MAAAPASTFRAHGMIGLALALAVVLLPAAPAAAAPAAVATHPELVAALADGAVDTIALAQDITIEYPSTGVSTSHDITLDLFGRVLTLPNITIASGTTLTIDDSVGGGLLVANPAGAAPSRAGITTTGATLEVVGGTITATGWLLASGIGGDSTGWSGGTYRQSGGSVTATGGFYGAGVGGSATGFSAPGADGGTIEVSGGVLVARGGQYAAGIGGGTLGAAGNVEISGGTVTASGGTAGPGIGNGYGYGYGYVGAPAEGAAEVDISGGDVTAHGDTRSVGVGGGFEAAGVALTLGAGARLTVSDEQGFQPLGRGEGSTATWWGSYEIAGTLVLGNDFQLPAGADIHVAPGGVVDGPGAFRQNIPGTPGGTIINGGSIRTTVDAWTEVTGNDSTVSFAANRTGATPATPPPLRVLAPTIADAGLALLALPTAPGALAWAWNTAPDGSGTGFDESTVLTGDTAVHAAWRGFTDLTVTADDDDIVAGAQVLLTVVGNERVSGLSSDQTAFATFVSSVGSDDIDGNRITMTRAGEHVLTASVGSVDGDVDGAATVSVAAAALDRITVTAWVGGSQVGTEGSATVAAGDEVALVVEGFDDYDNSLGDLAADATMTTTGPEPVSAGILAPTVVGERTVTVVVDGLTATIELEVIPGALSTAVIDLLQTWVAGTPTAPVTVEGRDAYGNSLGLLPSSAYWFTSTEPTDDVAGPELVGYRAGSRSIEIEVGPLHTTFSYTVTVVPAGIDSIAVGGIDFVTVGGWAVAEAWASDAWGNSIGDVTADVTFSTDSPGAAVDGHRIYFVRAGAAELTGALADDPSITATHPIDVVAGPLAVILVDPSDDTVTAGQDLTFAFRGTDVHGNPVSLCGCSLTLATDEASDVVVDDEITFERAGVRRVTATLPGTAHSPAVSGTIDVTVVPAEPVAVTLSAPSVRVHQGGSLTFAVSGVDAFGNTIAAAPGATLESDVPTDIVDGLTVRFPHASPHVITARVGPLTSSVTVEVTPRPALPHTGGTVSAGVFALACALLAAGALIRRTRPASPRR